MLSIKEYRKILNDYSTPDEKIKKRIGIDVTEQAVDNEIVKEEPKKEALKAEIKKEKLKTEKK